MGAHEREAEQRRLAVIGADSTENPPPVASHPSTQTRHYVQLQRRHGNNLQRVPIGSITVKYYI